MAVHKCVLAKEVNGQIEYIYPKTTSDIVEYDKSLSVQKKIEAVDNDIAHTNSRIDTIASGVTTGSISTKNDAELFDIRNPNNKIVPVGTKYDSAGAAVRGQLGSLSDKIDNQIGDLYKGFYYETISVNGEPLGIVNKSNPAEEFVITVTLYDLMHKEIDMLTNIINQYIVSARDSAIALSNDNLRYAKDYAKEYTDVLRKEITKEVDDVKRFTCYVPYNPELKPEQQVTTKTYIDAQDGKVQKYVDDRETVINNKFDTDTTNVLNLSIK